MLHKLISFFLPLLAPTIAYLIWAHLRQRNAAEAAAGHPVQGWRSWPWVSLIGTGVALAIGVTVSVHLLTADADRGIYVPPHMKNGELVPGTFVPEEEAGSVEQ